MHGFQYQEGKLHCEEVSIQAIAETHGTPLYVYSANTIRDHFNRLDQALAELDHHVAYAVKANSNIAILNLLAKEGAGFDIVSAGELFRVLEAGGKADQCTFAGVGKTDEEIRYAIDKGIYCFNVESEAELRNINRIALLMDAVAPVALRVNPNVDAKTHKYISTGKSENKFGIDFDQIEALYQTTADEMPGVSLRGLQMHIGSQLTTVAPFIEAIKKVGPLVEKLKAAHGIEFFSIGGGVGIVYDQALDSAKSDWWDKEAEELPLTIDAYASQIVPLLAPLKLKIMLEPGRLIVGNAGALVSKCLYHKNGTAKNFRIVDAGMNDLIRPALYQGHHEIVPVTSRENSEKLSIDVVGPICESGDFFSQDREMENFQEGDLIALLSSGAYGFTMASNYNSRPMAAEVLVDGDSAHLIRARQSFEDLIKGESIPQS